jgi:hypothetical protein
MMQTRYACAITGILAAIGMSSCGSSSKPSSAGGPGQPSTNTPLDRGFIARADAVCARAKSRTDAYGEFPFQNFDPIHPDVKLLPRVGAFFAQEQSTRDHVPGELRQLGAPQQGAALWRRLVALVAQNRITNDRQIAAANAADASAFVATVDEAQHSHDQIQQLGKSAGFSAGSPCKALY